ncbi:MAG: gliding motility-associated C-terminal domain-containing protein [Bacteroidales bacterium]|nr:gliding motility-associated C-terminal domain-containing protein [Bacteroidales bacterium]
MKSARLISMSLLCIVLMPCLAGQDETQPLSPQLDMVTVDPITGFATVKWFLSASPDVASYVVYTFSDGTASAIDTVRSPYETMYTHTASAARYRSITYVVAAIDSSLNISPLSNGLSTIFLSSVNDTCNSTINLAWTPYDNSFHPAGSYEVRIATGNGAAILHETLPSNESTYLFSGYDPGTEYCFYITASDDGTGLSSSNRECVTTGSESAPSFIRVDAVAVAGKALQFLVSYDQTTTMDDFALLQFNPVTASWENAAGAGGINGALSLSYPGADTGRVSLYRITILNNCNVTMASSGNIRNMVLESAVTGTIIALSWNNPFPEGEALFSVWREAGDGWIEVASHLSDTAWSDDYSLFSTDVAAAELAYQVTATSPDAPVGTPLHRSSVTTVPATENIFIPNAFTPERGGENAFFRPEFSFIPVTYEFRVYSRGGVLLFQTSDYAAGWDGRSNGTIHPAGVYLYTLRLTTPAGRTEARRGTVTILP